MTEVEFVLEADGFLARIGKLSSTVKDGIHQKTKAAALEVELRAKHTARKRYGFLRASIGHVDTAYISGMPKNPPIVTGIWNEEFADIELGSGLAYALAMEHYQGAPAYGPTGAYEYATGGDMEYGEGLPGKVKKPRARKGPPSEGTSPFLVPALLQVFPLYEKAVLELIRGGLTG